VKTATLDDKLKRPTTTTTIAVITLPLALLFLASAPTFVNLPQSFAETSQASSEVQLQLTTTSTYLDCGDQVYPGGTVHRDSDNDNYYCYPNTNEP
jgi:hypothetical protein